MGYIESGGDRLHYVTWGNGPNLLVAFHGYGNDATVFVPLIPYLTKQYTIVSFDLPYHGQSQWQDNHLFDTGKLGAFFEKTLLLYGAQRACVMGYSMGGRLGLALAGYIPHKISSLVLIAPDGLVADVYYRFLTGTRIGVFIFEDLIHKPEKYIRLCDRLRNMGAIHESKHKFVLKYIKSRQARDFLHQVWPAMKEFRPDINRVRKWILENRVPVVLFMGENDGIVPPKRAFKFQAGLNTVQVVVTKRGHRVFDDDNAGEVAAFILALVEASV